MAVDLPDPAAPTLDAEALAELAPFGEERVVETGDVLYRAGDESYDFFVVLEGTVDIIRPDLEGETLITTHIAGRFLGELNMLTGQRLPHRPGQPARSRPGDSRRRVPAGHEQQAGSRRHDLFGLRRPPEVLRTGEGARSADHRLPLLARSDGVACVRGPVSSPPHVDRHRG